jgi:hypothetical protein
MVMKDGFVNSVTLLHQFAEKMLEALQHMEGVTSYASGTNLVLNRADL